MFCWIGSNTKLVANFAPLLELVASALAHAWA
jgi:hypothetical protein